MKNKRCVILFVIYCGLYLGTNTNGYCKPISGSEFLANSVEISESGLINYQESKPVTSEASFGGITLLLGLLALYGVKKLADATFNNINQTD